jgi:hypothetical protein
MLGFVISVVVSTGVGLAITATSVVTSVVMNVTAATARLGYRYIRDRWKREENDPEKTETNRENSSAVFHDSSKDALEEE